MFTKARKFVALDAGQKALFIRVWFMLGWMRAAVLALPFKRLLAHLYRHHRSIDLPPLEPAQMAYACRVGRLVAGAASLTPWKSLCLVQVLVVQRLLARRSIPGQIYLGVRKGSPADSNLQTLSSHAWLQCADTVVSGVGGHEQFIVVSTFSWNGRGD